MSFGLKRFFNRKFVLDYSFQRSFFDYPSSFGTFFKKIFYNNKVSIYIAKIVTILYIIIFFSLF